MHCKSVYVACKKRSKTIKSNSDSNCVIQNMQVDVILHFYSRCFISFSINQAFYNRILTKFVEVCLSSFFQSYSECMHFDYNEPVCVHIKTVNYCTEDNLNSNKCRYFSIFMTPVLKCQCY